MSPLVCDLRFYGGVDVWTKDEAWKELNRELERKMNAFHRDLERKRDHLRYLTHSDKTQQTLHETAVQWKIKRIEAELASALSDDVANAHLEWKSIEEELERTFATELTHMIEERMQAISNKSNALRVLLSSLALQDEAFSRRLPMSLVGMHMFLILMLQLHVRVLCRPGIRHHSLLGFCICLGFVIMAVYSSRGMGWAVRRRRKELLSIKAEVSTMRDMKYFLEEDISLLRKSSIAKAKRFWGRVELDLQVKLVKTKQRFSELQETHSRLLSGVWTIFEKSMMASISPQRLSSSQYQTLQNVFQAFSAACPEEVRTIEVSAQEEWKAGNDELKSQQIEFDLDMGRIRTAREQELEQKFLSRSTSTNLLFRGFFTFHEPVEQLSLPLQLSLGSLGCPAACALKGVSTAFAAEISRFAYHCAQCPAVWRCPVCSFAVPPCTDQCSLAEAHQKKCAAWQIDGLLVLHFLADPPQQPTAIIQEGIRLAAMVVDRQDFVGKEIDKIRWDMSICCPQFGCNEGFPSREQALQHAVSCCSRRCRPPWSIEELTTFKKKKKSQIFCGQ